MAKESNAPQGAAKKPALDTPTRVGEPAALQKNKSPMPKNSPTNPAVGKTTAEPIEIDGKIVRTDSPAIDGATQAFGEDTIASNPPPKQPANLAATQALGQETIAPESPEGSDMSSTPTSKSGDEQGSAPAGAVKGATILGDFKLLKKIGQGGMGAVYKAQQVSTNRVVAVKVLAKELSGKDSYVQRFQRESRVMKELDHPNVLGCIEFGEARGFHYIAMEFVEGGSVEAWFKKLGRFSVGDALHIILKTAEGLKHAHEKNMIHRDIKPDNILLTKDGVVKVADLGLAKDTEEDTSLTKTGAGAGTPIYMAPEQARDVKHVDARVDIYAMGVMLYHFLTGKPPFKGATLVELISAKDIGKFDPIRKYNDEVPSKLDLIVDKMIAKDLKLRYASCDEVINALTPLGLANEELSFMTSAEEEPTAPATKTKRIVKPVTDTPAPAAKASPKTSMGTAAKATSKTSIGATAKGSAAKTNVPEEVEEAEHDVWYWKLVTQEGKSTTKKVTTDQIRVLIKSGHLEQTAEVSKTEKTGFRAAATFQEFQGAFKTRETATKANTKGQKYRDQYKEIEAADARRRRWGWLTRRFKGVGGMLLGLLWIVLILALVGAAGYVGWTYFLRP